MVAFQQRVVDEKTGRSWRTHRGVHGVARGASRRGWFSLLGTQKGPAGGLGSV